MIDEYEQIEPLPEDTDEELRLDFQLHLDAGLEFIKRDGDKDIFKGTKEQWEKYYELSGTEWDRLELSPEYQSFGQLIFNN